MLHPNIRKNTPNIYKCHSNRYYPLGINTFNWNSFVFVLLPRKIYLNEWFAFALVETMAATPHPLWSVGYHVAVSIVHFVSRILFMEPLWWLCYTPFRFEVWLCVFLMSITYLFYLDRISIKITHHHCWRMRISGCVTRGKMAKQTKYTPQRDRINYSVPRIPMECWAVGAS